MDTPPDAIAESLGTLVDYCMGYTLNASDDSCHYKVVGCRDGTRTCSCDLQDDATYGY